MGGRYWITGVQLGIIKALSENIDISETKKIAEIIRDVEDKQFIMNKEIDNIIDNFMIMDNMLNKRKGKAKK